MDMLWMGVRMGSIVRNRNSILQSPFNSTPASTRARDILLSYIVSH